MFNIDLTRLEDPIRPLGAPIRPEPPKPEPPAEQWVPTGTPGYSRSTTTDKVRNDTYKLLEPRQQMISLWRPAVFTYADYSAAWDRARARGATGDQCVQCVETVDTVTGGDWQSLTAALDALQPTGTAS
ncbi:MAG: hypothetical protein V4792_09940 [Pseudomonadota bacterium]